MAKSDYRKGAIPYQFAALPMEVIRSPAWQELPPSAVKLAIDLMSQYTGKNNGRLCAAFEAMQKNGWKNKHTLIAAKRALLECPFVVRTRKGHAPRTAEWIAFTWWNLNYEKSMDINPKTFPYLSFFEVKRIDPNSGRGDEPDKLNCEVQKMHHTRKKDALGGAEIAPQAIAA